ncbi:MAG: hypothetical protein A2Y69_10840 [Candidatus Aminicenantes bacterium RBG_13_59_9]|nr:MAG: hypothetical protein A2Y69_10840 [Candidatus Aminicenantes bacterium RBG_13_59_9]
MESGRQNFSFSTLLKLSRALEIQPYALFSDKNLVHYQEKTPDIKFEVRERGLISGSTSAYEAIKLFQDPLSLGPGWEISDEPPIDYAPLQKKFLPRGYSSPPDRIIAFPTIGHSMSPTINEGSIVWIDRLDLQAREGQIYAFLLPDKTITIKRLVKLNEDHLIVDGDNRDTEARKGEELRGYPKTVFLQEDISVIRGRVIWVLNKLI